MHRLVPEAAKKSQLIRYSLLVSLKSAVILAESKLQSERDERKRIEVVVDDVERECRAPFIVPKMVQAMLKAEDMSI